MNPSNSQILLRKTRKPLRLGLLSLGASLAASLLATSPVNAGTLLTPTLDGSLSEWTSIPVAYTNTGATPDISTIQVANDGNYVYLGITFSSALNLEFTNGGHSTSLVFDTDSNPATGFNIYGLGTVGSEINYTNDAPFQQGPGPGDWWAGSVSNGTGLLAPYNSSSVLTMEIGIPLNATYDNGGLPVFSSDSFNLAMYIDGLNGNNFTGPISYTLAAAVPEPSSLAFLVGGLVLTVGVGRYRRGASRVS